MTTYCPFVEKHRPKHFDDIVLDPLNKKILKSMITSGQFPNVLFYGPPGTGKTTTIINTIQSYQRHNYGKEDIGLTIQLNASDERGIDIIRNQISSFVSSCPLFNNGIKFVILDEVDYMTKNAQQALKYLLQEYPSNVRFCLICNYISKIDEGLQNEFLKIRFDQLPINHVIEFLNKLSKEEKINLSKDTLLSIQKLYKSDIRSMVNFIQTNQDILTTHYNIISEDTWISLYNTVCENKNLTNQDLLLKLNTISIQYNIDMRNIIVNFLNYIIKKYKHVVTPDFLLFAENIIHGDMNNDCGLQYFFNELQEYVITQ